MPKRRPERVYHYRGGVERGARYEWRDGYSETTVDGDVQYPWMTRKECREEAARDGMRAVFYCDGRKES